MSQKNTLEPYIISVLSSRIDGIGVEMAHTMVRTARSGVINICKDLSTAICDSKGDVISIPITAIHVHSTAMSLVGRNLLELHRKDLRPGDCFLNNSPYHGCTHHADHTLLAPVFYKDELIFIVAARGHQADIGNATPTTYSPFAKDIYEEGAINFPCVRVQRDYKDVDDIIRMAKMRIRCPDIWYGDFLASVGALRIGERRLIEACDEFGVDVINAFTEQWQEYGKSMMISEIRKFPKGTWYDNNRHDPVPGVPEGMPIKLKMSIDPDEGYITLDFTENTIECQPNGFNLSECTLTAAGRTAVMLRLGPEIPHCEGAMSRIIVKMKENRAIGKAVLPFSASIATTNYCERVISVTMTCMNQITDKRGSAEGGTLGLPSASVISGKDWRYGNRDYVNQLIFGYTGGPGINGYDGWVTYLGTQGNGVMYWSSIELIEQVYPILIVKCELTRDTAAAGQYDSSPSCRTDIAARKSPVTAAYFCDGCVFPPRGAKRGENSRPTGAWKYELKMGDTSRVELPKMAVEVIDQGEVLVSESSTGAGYGDPLDRDPERVRYRVREEWLSVERAREVYGVVIDTGPELYAVDYKATEELRASLRRKREENAKRKA